MNGKVYKKLYKSPKLNINEALRYAGSAQDDEASRELLLRCFDQAESRLSYKTVMARYPISLSGDEIDLGFCKVRSHSLGICLDGCHEILLFCATVGNEIDRLIEKNRLISTAYGVMMSALGSERVESLCDEICAEIEAREAERGNIICPRFSPGYGDLPIEIQREIFSALDVTSNIGVSLKENLFMRPSKSVTAIVGIKKG